MLVAVSVVKDGICGGDPTFRAAQDALVKPLLMRWRCQRPARAPSAELDRLQHLNFKSGGSGGGQGQSDQVEFNGRYLCDALDVLRCPQVGAAITSSRSRSIVAPSLIESKPHLHLRLRWSAPSTLLKAQDQRPWPATACSRWLSGEPGSVQVACVFGVRFGPTRSSTRRCGRST